MKYLICLFLFSMTAYSTAENSVKVSNINEISNVLSDPQKLQHSANCVESLTAAPDSGGLFFVFDLPGFGTASLDFEKIGSLCKMGSYKGTMSSGLSGGMTCKFTYKSGDSMEGDEYSTAEKHLKFTCVHLDTKTLSDHARSHGYNQVSTKLSHAFNPQNHKAKDPACTFSGARLFRK